MYRVPRPGALQRGRRVCKVRLPGLGKVGLGISVPLLPNCESGLQARLLESPGFMAWILAWS